MTWNRFRLAAAGVLAAGVLSAALPAPALAAQLPGGGYGNKGGNNKGMKEEEKPKPVVIRLQSAQKGKLYGQEVMLVTGQEALTGKPRTFAVENEKPQNKNAPPKYEPQARVKEGIDRVKPGEFLKVEPKAGRDATLWIDKAEPYLPKPHEEDPGTFVLYEAYKDNKGGTDVFVITLVKFGAYLDCYAQMVKDGKTSAPDPEVVKVAEEIINRAKDPKKKELVEATVTQGGGANFVTSLTPFQAPKQGKFGKLVELEEDGKTLTLAIPGKLAGKKWVTDADLLADAKRLKPGTAVVFKTKDVGEKSYLRMLAPAPKESAKKETAGSEAGGPMLKSKK